jgi:hypothetical protein
MAIYLSRKQPKQTQLHSLDFGYSSVRVLELLSMTREIEVARTHDLFHSPQKPVDLDEALEGVIQPYREVFIRNIEGRYGKERPIAYIVHGDVFIYGKYIENQSYDVCLENQDKLGHRNASVKLKLFDPKRKDLGIITGVPQALGIEYAINSGCSRRFRKEMNRLHEQIKRHSDCS